MQMPKVINEASQILVSFLTRGKNGQDFLGARWITFLLRSLPVSQRRRAALWVLSLSPHYFFKNDANRGLTKRYFLEAEFQRNWDSRHAISEKVLKKYINKADVVLDYGCGPGWLSRSVSPYVNLVFACDISKGVVECASILNSGPNIQYFIVSEDEKLPIGDSFIDVVYSFAVIQHVTDNVFLQILKTFHRVLKAGGTVLCHIVVDNSNWQSETECRNDATFRGRVKWDHCLHCFSRSKKDVIQKITTTGFSNPEIFLIRELADIFGDDIENQHLFVFKKLDSTS